MPAEALKPTPPEVPGGSPATKDVGESESINAWPEATAEAEFLASAQATGETVKPPAAVTVAVEVESSPLPALDDLVPRIPADVREMLDDLFRVKFVSVRRISKQALAHSPAKPT